MTRSLASPNGFYQTWANLARDFRPAADSLNPQQAVRPQSGQQISRPRPEHARAPIASPDRVRRSRAPIACADRVRRSGQV